MTPVPDYFPIHDRILGRMVQTRLRHRRLSVMVKKGQSHEIDGIVNEVAAVSRRADALSAQWLALAKEILTLQTTARADGHGGARSRDLVEAKHREASDLLADWEDAAADLDGLCRRLESFAERGLLRSR